MSECLFSEKGMKHFSIFGCMCFKRYYLVYPSSIFQCAIFCFMITFIDVSELMFCSRCPGQGGIPTVGISAKRSQPRDFSQEISAKGSQPRDLSQEILAKSSQPRDPSQGNSAKGSRPGMFSQVMSADPWKRRDLNKQLLGSRALV